MKKRDFRNLIEGRWSCGKFVCIGLDSELSKIPECVRSDTTGHRTYSIFIFNKRIVDATSNLVCAYKLQCAFYEAYGDEGLIALKLTIGYIHEVAPEVPVILDAKRADIGSTNAGYVRAAFDFLQADAITINPYFGEKSLRPFLERKEKGIFVHCLSSDDGAEEFQYQPVSLRRNELDEIEKLLGHATHHNGVPLYEYVAYKVAHSWNKNDNCGLVVGATRSDELCEIRKVIGDSIPILSPGIGTQGGNAYEAFTAGKNSKGRGLIPSSSSSIIFASDGEDFAEAAHRETKKIAEEIHRARLKDGCRLYDGQASSL